MKVREIDVSSARKFRVHGFVVGGAGSRENVDDAKVSLHLYDDAVIGDMRQLGILRCTRKELEEIVLQANTLLGLHINAIEDASKKEG